MIFVVVVIVQFVLSISDIYTHTCVTYAVYDCLMLKNNGINLANNIIIIKPLMRRNSYV